MNEVIRLIWQCELCKDVVISYSSVRHDMNFCECGKSGVDFEEHYQREAGKVKEISRKRNVNGIWEKVLKYNDIL